MSSRLRPAHFARSPRHESHSLRHPPPLACNRRRASARWLRSGHAVPQRRRTHSLRQFPLDGNWHREWPSGIARLASQLAETRHEPTPVLPCSTASESCCGRSSIRFGAAAARRATPEQPSGSREGECRCPRRRPPSRADSPLQVTPKRVVKAVSNVHRTQQALCISGAGAGDQI